jgi:two-component system response regulator
VNATCTLNILLVEDDANDVRLMVQALARNGIAPHLEVVNDGEEALHYLQHWGEFSNRMEHPFPDVIFIDLKMPRVGGLEVLRWLHNNPACPVVPTIIFSASRMDDDIKEAYRLGASSYFVKPTEFEELQYLVKIMYEYWHRAEHPPLPVGC